MGGTDAIGAIGTATLAPGYVVEDAPCRCGWLAGGAEGDMPLIPSSPRRCRDAALLPAPLTGLGPIVGGSAGGAADMIREDSAIDGIGGIGDIFGIGGIGVAEAADINVLSLDGWTPSMPIRWRDASAEFP